VAGGVWLGWRSPVVALVPVAASVRLRVSGWRGMVAASTCWWGLDLEGGPPAGGAVQR